MQRDDAAKVRIETATLFDGDEGLLQGA